MHACLPGSLLTTKGTHMQEVASSAMASSSDFSASWIWMWLSWKGGAVVAIKYLSFVNCVLHALMSPELWPHNVSHMIASYNR